MLYPPWFISSLPLFPKLKNFNDIWLSHNSHPVWSLVFFFFARFQLRKFDCILWSFHENFELRNFAFCDLFENFLLENSYKLIFSSFLHSKLFFALDNYYFIVRRENFIWSLFHRITRFSSSKQISSTFFRATFVVIRNLIALKKS